MIALERRHATGSADMAFGDLVEIERRHARPRALSEQPKRLCDDRASRRHPIKVVGRLAVNHAGRAASSRAATSSVVPMPSIRTSRTPTCW